MSTPTSAAAEHEDLRMRMLTAFYHIRAILKPYTRDDQAETHARRFAENAIAELEQVNLALAPAEDEQELTIARNSIRELLAELRAYAWDVDPRTAGGEGGNSFGNLAKKVLQWANKVISL